MRAEDEEQSKVFYELCSIIIQILKSPPLPFPDRLSSASSSKQSLTKISPTSFASLFIGISLSLMLFGSVTFVIGFVLMPGVLGLAFLFLFASLLSTLSEFWRSIFYTPPPCHSVPDWRFSETEAYFSIVEGIES